MTDLSKKGVTINLDDKEYEKLIKIVLKNAKVDVDNKGEAISSAVNNMPDVITRLEKMEEDFIQSCEIVRKFMIYSEKLYQDLLKMMDTEKQNKEEAFSMMSEKIKDCNLLVMGMANQIGEFLKQGGKFKSDEQKNVPMKNDKNCKLGNYYNVVKLPQTYHRRGEKNKNSGGHNDGYILISGGHVDAGCEKSSSSNDDKVNVLDGNRSGNMEI